MPLASRRVGLSVTSIETILCDVGEKLTGVLMQSRRRAAFGLWTLPWPAAAVPLAIVQSALAQATPETSPLPAPGPPTTPPNATPTQVDTPLADSAAPASAPVAPPPPPPVVAAPTSIP